MYSIDFWLAVAVLAAVPFWMAAYGGHVAAESIGEGRHRRYVRLKFWGIGVVGLAACASSVRLLTWSYIKSVP